MGEDLYKIFSEDSLVMSCNKLLCYIKGKTAFDFNSGFHVGELFKKQIALNWLMQIDASIPKVRESDKDYGIETSNIPLVVWKIQSIQK